MTSLADGARGTRLDRALDLAEGELSGARHADRRLVVLSDFAAHASLLEARLPSHLQLRFERFGEAAPDNVAVVSARATLDPTRPSRAQLAAEVRAPGRDGEALPVVVRRGDAELLRRDLEVVDGVARLNARVPLDPGQPAALIEVEVDDALPLDDRRAVLLRPPSSVRVLVVRGDGEASRAGGRFLARALELAPAEGGALSRRLVDPDTFATLDLADSEVLVLADAPAPDGAVAARIRAHVERGGGLLLTGGDAASTRALRSRLRGLLPARLSGPLSGTVDGPQPVGDEASAGLQAASTRAGVDQGVVSADRRHIP